MSLRQRIAKLERDTGGGACVCVPESRRVRVQWPDDASGLNPEGADQHCPECGGELLLIVVQLDAPNGHEYGGMNDR